MFDPSSNKDELDSSVNTKELDLSLSKDEFKQLIEYYEKTDFADLNSNSLKTAVDITTIVNNALEEDFSIIRDHEWEYENNNADIPFIHYRDLDSIHGYYANRPTRYLSSRSAQANHEDTETNSQPADNNNAASVSDKLIYVKPGSIVLSKGSHRDEASHFIWGGEKDLVCSTNFFAIKPKEPTNSVSNTKTKTTSSLGSKSDVNAIDVTYLSAFLGSKAYNAMVSRSMKGLIPYLNKRDIENLYVPFPPLKIQQQVGKVFYIWQEIIQSLQNELENRNKLKIVYHDYLMRDVTKKYTYIQDGKLHIDQNTQHAVGQKYQLKELATISLGKVRSASDTIYENDSLDTKYPLYSATNDDNSPVGYTYLENPHPAGTISYTMAGWRSGSFTYRDHEYHATRMCGVIEIKDTAKHLVDARFLAQYLNHLLNNNGNTIGNFYENTRSFGTGMMGDLEIELPKIEVQKFLGELFQSQIDMIQAVEEEIRIRKEELDYFLDLFFSYEDLNAVALTRKREAIKARTKEDTKRASAQAKFAPAVAEPTGTNAETEETSATSATTTSTTTSTSTSSTDADTRTAQSGLATTASDVASNAMPTTAAPSTATAATAAAATTAQATTAAATTPATHSTTTSPTAPAEAAPALFNLEMLMKMYQEQMSRILTTETGEEQIRQISQLNKVLQDMTENISKLQQLSQAIGTPAPSSTTPAQVAPATAPATATSAGEAKLASENEAADTDAQAEELPLLNISNLV